MCAAAASACPGYLPAAPGNIRELQNIIERSVVLTRGRILESAMPEINIGSRAANQPSDTRSAAEREGILQALKDAKGLAGGPNGEAKRLALKRTTLQARMKKLGRLVNIDK